jgi:hypothetical protein
LSTIEKETRVDIYSETGRQQICDTLLPKNLTRGHWFKGAGDAFLPEKVRIGFEDRVTSSIVRLRPDIAGFEMVVASSNNAAVENISRDLPKRSSLKEPWLSSSYIQSVAHKIAAQKGNGLCEKLPENDVPWGLVSCVLGKAGNRCRFKECFAFNEIKPDAKPTWSGDSKPETIWEWARNFKGPSFIGAVCNFREAQANVEKNIADLNRFAELPSQVNEKAIEARKDALSAANENCVEARKQVFDAEKSIDDSAAELRRLKEEEHLIDRTRPVWWKRLLGTPEATSHKNDVSINASAQLRVLEMQREIQAQLTNTLYPKLSAAQIAVTQAETALAKQLHIIQSELAELNELRDRFEGTSFLESPGDVELDSIQKTCS